MDLRRRFFVNVFKFMDLMIVFGWFVALISISLDQQDVFWGFLNLKIRLKHLLLIIGYLFVCHRIFKGFRLYHSRRLSTIAVEIIHIVYAITICSVILALTAFFFNITAVDLRFSFLFWISTCCTVIFSRIFLRFVLKQIRLRGRNLRTMLIVGTNKQAVQFAKNIEAMPEIGYVLVGFVDEDWKGMDEFNATGYKIVSTFSGFNSYIRNNVIDEVAIFLPIKSKYTQASKILSICEEQGVVYRNSAKLFESKSTRSESSLFQGYYLTTHYRGTMNGWRVMIKRLMDILISGLGLFILAPLLILVAVWIKKTSKGPAFFVQKRLGHNKRIFNLYKFRTMVVDAEEQMSKIEELNEASGPVFKIKNDPRITSVGHFLRKSSIDELPQLINVFRGDMSIVGPRPLPVRDYEGFEKDWHRRRFSVKPGITCLWQVKGRSSIPFEKWMELDMRYIDKWSLSLDMKILLMTLPAVLKGSGAE